MREQYWIEALFERDNKIIVGAVGRDGLLIQLDLVDAKELLVSYPKDQEGWWFSSSKDRYIAEFSNNNKVIANPQLIWMAGFTIHS